MFVIWNLVGPNTVTAVRRATMKGASVKLNDKIAANYRKAIGSIVWHHYTTCMSWPTHNFIGSKNPGGEEICSQCMALHALREKTCPLIVFEKPCGLQLTPHPDGLHYCELGHRIRIVEIE